ESGAVIAVIRAESRGTAAVEAYAIEVVLDRRMLCGGEVDPSVVRGTVECAHIPVARSDRALDRAVAATMVDMTKTGAVAEPEKGAVAEPLRQSDDLDPVLALLVKQCADRTRPGIRHVEVQLALESVLHLEDNALRVRCPADADD